MEDNILFKDRSAKFLGIKVTEILNWVKVQVKRLTVATFDWSTDCKSQCIEIFLSRSVLAVFTM